MSDPRTAADRDELAATYARRMADLRLAKHTALEAWNALTTEDARIRGLEAERDDLIAEAARAEASGDMYGPAYWNRKDAEEIQKRIDAARKPKCPTCGARCGCGGEQP